MPNIALRELALTRSRVYDFLGSVYLKVPNPDLVERFMKEPSLPGEFHGMAMLREFFTRNRGKTPQELQESLALEHSRLLSGISYGYGPPPPYESVWIGQGRVMGASTVDVMKAYSEAGLELVAKNREPPDHVGIELGFISYLCRKEADAWTNDDFSETMKLLQMEQRFLTDHMQKWIPHLCEEIMNSDRTGFYHGIAMITRECLANEDKAIEELLRTLTTA